MEDYDFEWSVMAPELTDSQVHGPVLLVKQFLILWTVLLLRWFFFLFSSLVHLDHSVKLDFKQFLVGSPVYIWRVRPSLSRGGTVEFQTYSNNHSEICPHDFKRKDIAKKVWKGNILFVFIAIVMSGLWGNRKGLWLLSVNLGNSLS